MSLGCHTYAEQDGQLERCQGLYTLERSWADAAAWCKKDGWTGLAVADTDKVEAALGEYMVWMNDELDADDGYSAWIAGQEMEDRQWKWSDATAFQRQSDQLSFRRLIHYGFLPIQVSTGGAVVQRVRHLGFRSIGRGFKFCSRQRCVTTLGKLFTPTCLCHQAV